jgi:acetyl esterase/lipase
MASGEDILTLPPPKADARVRYGSDEDQFIDLRLPQSSGPHALAIIIHGGFWRARYDLLYMGHLCAALSEKGIATANLEYRRVGNPGGGWPGTFADIRAAFQFLSQNASRYHFDPKRTAVIGHSAGAQLALCLAAREPQIESAVSLAGVIDLQQSYALHLSSDAVVEFLGGTPSVAADHYREADPMSLAIKSRQYVVHGSLDEIVPPAFSRDYVQKKRAAKENVQLVEIAKAGHFELVDPRSSAGKKVEEVIVSAVK